MPNCLAKLQMPKSQITEIVCRSCKTSWAKKHGVWDFRLSQKTKSLAIFQETEYLRWLDIFGKREISSWKIYATKLNRFFSQAGHRMLARKLNLDVDERQWVVEVGAGDGLFYQYAPRKNYIGIDTNWDALSKFSKKNPNVMLICTNGVAMHYERNHRCIGFVAYIRTYLLFGRIYGRGNSCFKIWR